MVDVSIVNETSLEANWNRQTDRQADRQTYVLGGCASKNQFCDYLCKIHQFYPAGEYWWYEVSKVWSVSQVRHFKQAPKLKECSSNKTKTRYLELEPNLVEVQQNFSIKTLGFDVFTLKKPTYQIFHSYLLHEWHVNLHACILAYMHSIILEHMHTCKFVYLNNSIHV